MGGNADGVEAGELGLRRPVSGAGISLVTFVSGGRSAAGGDDRTGANRKGAGTVSRMEVAPTGPNDNAL